MDAIGFLAAGIFGFGYLLITLEQRFGTHKSAIALVMGCVLWLIAAVALSQHPELLEEALTHAGAEIFSIVAFLLGAMALIEILVHYGLFDIIRLKLSNMKVSDKQQYLIMMGMTFFLSALLDNIAVTIAMLQIARRFFKDKNLLIAAASIVIAANAGGAWSPIGDVTTILLWLADKFTAFEVVTYAFLPSFALFLTSTGLLYRQLNDEDFAEKEEANISKPSLSEKIVIGTAVISFTFPLFMNLVGLPPYIGLLLGLGLTWMIIEFAKQKSRKEHRSHLTANIEKLVQMVDISSIKFIIGILLSVSALSAIGVLTVVSSVAIGEAPSQGTLLLVNIMIGIFSSIIDNASLVAVAIDIIPTTDPIVWSLLAVTAGTGGSIFVIASAAGVVASGTIKQLTFANYFKVATIPALAGFVVGVLVWMLQHMVF